jgi:type II secretory pathway predicted ATPase ExeA
MLKFRWEVASGGERHPFTDEAVAAIFRASEGMPREANILADNSLLLAFVRKERHIGQTVVEEAVMDRQLNLSRKGAST